MVEYHDLEPGQAFTNGDVIGYKGENYYRACDAFVANNDDGGQAFCVKRVNHPGHIHEAYDGRVRVAFSKSGDDEVKGIIDMDFKTKSLETAVYEAIGAASVCWENMSGTGIFQEDRARDIAEQLLHRIMQAQPIYG